MNIRKHGWGRYALALSAVLIALLLRYMLTPVIGTGTVYIIAYPAMIIVAMTLGSGPGLVGMTFGIVLIELFMVEPAGQLKLSASLAVRSAILLLTIFYVGRVGEQLRRAKEEADAQADSMRKADTAFRASEERFRELIEQAADGIFVSDALGRYLDVNSAGARMLGYEKKEILSLTIAGVIAEEEVPRIPAEVAKFTGGAVVHSEWQFRRKDGSFFTGEVVGRQLNDGRLQAILRDITERKRTEGALKASRIAALNLMEDALEARREAEEKSVRLSQEVAERRKAEEGLSELNEALEERIQQRTRFYALLAGINETIFRMRDKKTLFGEVCRIMVEAGGFRLAWVGLLDPESREISIEESYGAREYLEGIKIIASDVPEGRGPTGRAIVEARHIINLDFEEDPNMTPWRERARKHSIRSSSAFPLRIRQDVIGALTIYSGEPSFFTNEEVSLLLSVADNISFALEAIEIAEKQQEISRRANVTHALLALFTHKLKRKDYLDAAVELIRDWSACTYAGVRVNDRGLHIPFESHIGYSSEFLKAEAALSLLEDRCICTRVALGKPEQHDMSAMTTHGSFKSNDTLKFLEGLSLEERTRYRGLCMQSGYRSLAVIPIRYREIIVGAIHVADEQGGMFSADKVAFLESLASIIGEAVFRFGIEEELRTLNKELEQRVTERTVQLETANRDLESFVYSVSHDLRAPLRSIYGFSEIVVDDYLERLDETGKDYLLRIRKGAAKMSRLIDDLLRLSLISRQEMQKSEVDMAGLASSIVSELREAHPGRHVDVKITECPKALADGRLIELALSNLIGNAWKFTEKTEQPRIEFGALERGGKTVYYISDNGAGFNPEYRHKMFWPFQRLHSEMEFEGTGIGLAIVERVIRRHDGEIWAEGEVGKGATVYFSLT
ncbi:MAG: GAF domain-containing protein [Thermodesulfovibrionales bacterium]